MMPTEQTVDKYLDASRFIRTLEEAERNHQLDNRGCIEQLETALSRCKDESERQETIIRSARDLAVHLSVAKGLYLAEIKRRVGLTREEGCLRAQAARSRRPDPNPEKIGFERWTKEHSISEAYARSLIKIADADDPAAAYEKILADPAKYYQRDIRAQLARRKIKPGDPLRMAKRAWYLLSPVQREAFADWIWDQVDGKKMAAD